MVLYGQGENTEENNKHDHSLEEFTSDSNLQFYLDWCPGINLEDRGVG